jgi:hypothetical protein
MSCASCAAWLEPGAPKQALSESAGTATSKKRLGIDKFQLPNGASEGKKALLF